MEYWSHFSVFYKEAPLDLIRKYFGTEVAFYFAWLEYFNVMLLPVSILGIVITAINFLILNFHYIHEMWVRKVLKDFFIHIFFITFFLVRKYVKVRTSPFALHAKLLDCAHSNPCRCIANKLSVAISLITTWLYHTRSVCLFGVSGFYSFLLLVYRKSIENNHISDKVF